MALTLITGFYAYTTYQLLVVQRKPLIKGEGPFYYHCESGGHSHPGVKLINFGGGPAFRLHVFARWKQTDHFHDNLPEKEIITDGYCDCIIKPNQTLIIVFSHPHHTFHCKYSEMDNVDNIVQIFDKNFTPQAFQSYEPEYLEIEYYDIYDKSHFERIK